MAGFWERKTLGVLLLTVMILGLLPTAAFAASFKDVEGHWAQQQIEAWLQKGLVNGYPDGTFRPDRPVTRAEFVTFVNRALGIKAAGNEETFADVPATAWYAGEVAAAKGAGCISGYPDGTFRPDNPISRQEAAVIVARILGLEGRGGQFADHEAISPWAGEAVEAVRAAGIMGGYPDGTFKPQNSITRAEAVVTLEKALEVKEPEKELQKVFDQAGVYGPEDGLELLEGSAAITVPGVTLQNLTITGDLLLAEGIGEGDVTLKGITVQGETIVKGGGANSINLEDCNLARLTVTKEGVRIVASGSTRVTVVTLERGAVLVSVVDDETGGFETVIIPEEAAPQARITLEGDFARVNVQGAVSELEIAAGKIHELNLEAPAKVTGAGSVITANVKAGGVELEKAPENLNIEEGIKVTVAGEEVEGKQEGDELPAAPEEDAAEERVRLAGIENFSLQVGETKTIGLSTNATSVTAASDNEGAASVTVDRVDGRFVIRVKGEELGTATITVTGTRRGYRGRSVSFEVAVEAAEIKAVFVEGEPLVGETLTARVMPPEATVTYQWQRAVDKNGPYTDIGGETGAAYKLTGADQRRYVRVLATGTGNYTGTLTSEAVGPVEPPGVVVESFNTHAGDDYKGVNVTFRLRGLVLSQVQSIRVQLGAEGRIIATNTANMAELRKLGDSVVQLSTPFFVTRGNYEGRQWIFDPYDGIKVKPVWVIVSITDTDGKTYTGTGGPLREEEVPFELTKPVINLDLNKGYFTIQDALAEAEPGNTVEVGRGSYNGNLEIEVEGLTLRAAEPGQVAIVTAGSNDPGDDYGGITIMADGVTIDGFVISQGARNAIIHTREAKNVTISNNHFRSMTLFDKSQRGIEVGCGPAEPSAIVIEGNQFTGLYYGLCINGGTQITVEGNHFANLGRGAVALAGPEHIGAVALRNNRAEKAGYLLYYLGEAFAVDLEGNELVETGLRNKEVGGSAQEQPGEDTAGKPAPVSLAVSPAGEAGETAEKQVSSDGAADEEGKAGVTTKEKLMRW